MAIGKTNISGKVLGNRPAPSRKSIGYWTTRLDEDEAQFELMYPLITNRKIYKPFKLGQIHGVLSHRDPESDIRVFSHLKRSIKLDEFADEMRNAFSEIREIDMIPYPDATQGPVTIITKDNRNLPLYVFGDGMRRWFYLLGNMLINRNASHLIEEVDASFHPAAQKDLSKRLVEYCNKYNNQLFLTSHSIEFADIFLETLYGEDGIITHENEDPVRVFTLKLSEDRREVEYWSLKGREAYENRVHYNLEIR